ncbi:arsinothricin resistance N-acetyltransferase ArsN1 family B [Piscinibacter sp. XHJ-5]|uniref:arsinothricin resistance N-acetyltransferase ArsN1 family B n=1 Tax=Piscinibacter sp. XHJ-5 TaxID=3037797 RepID=UPI002452CC85|nr:arsinothricin resistance N-acetyltransferase ArsN1 family B [Piscinibacter sp. XHJ-5]
MKIRLATPDDAEALAAIYGPIVAHTAISVEFEPPSIEEMRSRIVSTMARLPWLVSVDARDEVTGYVYASRHRERAGYQWSVDTTAYVRDGHRGHGIGKRLYAVLFDELTRLGYFQAFAGIALPNEASIALHESLGFTPIGVYRDVAYKLGAWRDVGWWQKRLRESGEPTPPSAFRPETFRIRTEAST